MLFQSILNEVLQKINPSNFCINLALDETESKDIYNGRKPAEMYVNKRAELNMEPYKISENGIFYPLEQLEKLNLSDNKPTHIVLSIGGNDVRVSLIANKGDLDKVIKEMKESGFYKNYAKAIDSILTQNRKIIMIVVYRPGPGFMIKLNDLNRLFEALIPGLLEEIRKRNLPVIDLSRTFNPLDSSDYGTTPIEPSNKSGMKIAKLIEFVLNDFNFDRDKSKIYYGEEGSYKIDINEKDYKYKFN